LYLELNIICNSYVYTVTTPLILKLIIGHGSESQHRNPEDFDLNFCHCENLKSYVIVSRLFRRWQRIDRGHRNCKTDFN